MATIDLTSTGTKMDGGDTLTFQAKDASGEDKFYIYHLWRDVEAESSHEVPDSPNNTGGTTNEVVRKNPMSVRGTLSIASGLRVPKVVNARGAFTQDSVGMLNQRDNLYALEGRLVTVYARSIRGGFFTGVLRMVRVLDTGQYDNSMLVQFEVKEDQNAGYNIVSALEEDTIVIPVPPPAENPDLKNAPPGAGGHTCTRAQRWGAAFAKYTGLSKVVELGKKVVEGAKKLGGLLKRGWKWAKGFVKGVVDKGKELLSDAVEGTKNFFKGIFQGACKA